MGLKEERNPFTTQYNNDYLNFCPIRIVVVHCLLTRTALLTRSPRRETCSKHNGLVRSGSTHKQQYGMHKSEISARWA